VIIIEAIQLAIVQLVNYRTIVSNMTLLADKELLLILLQAVLLTIKQVLLDYM
jgi:hypothetical protein